MDVSAERQCVIFLGIMSCTFFLGLAIILVGGVLWIWQEPTPARLVSFGICVTAVSVVLGCIMSATLTDMRAKT